MTPHYTNIHNRFKINGFHLDRDSLFQLAYSLIKEGEDFEKEVGMFLLDWFDAKDYVEAQTSGTTGEPKIVRIDKQAMVNSALATGDFFELEPGNTALNCLPARFIAGKLMLVRSIILGLEMDMVSPKGNPLAHTYKNYDFAAMVPLQVEHALENIEQIDKLIIGGAKVSQDLIESLKGKKTKSYETYGMTETITHIAAKPIGEEVFTVLPGIKVAKDIEGCLVIEAPRVSDEKIFTHDLVEITGKNTFKWIGRKDNIINSGGIKIIPELVEKKLDGKLKSRYFITSKPDKHLGQKVVLAIEGKDNIDTKIFEVLDTYEKPKEVVYISRFSETENGKINRKETLEKNGLV
ncbi:AMP-binding protein [Flavobacterium sp. NRK F10]|uniref:AMP-binding protein n=1 Tax=Flavobacterium sp. NRK F10 TaxID=2954931 RepID=UPI0020902005|nr:AMP-binding protein [Flavobacterium sp. NRK F10]MCO6176149.1 AMP-binding protein [Flavobacterium sp. NRK F10]